MTLDHINPLSMGGEEMWKILLALATLVTYSKEIFFLMILWNVSQKSLYVSNGKEE